jgi:site-specific recombinase XerD
MESSLWREWADFMVAMSQECLRNVILVITTLSFGAPSKARARVTWQVFRHSYATLLKGNGEDVKTVQESLRHSTVRMTMETYTQAIPEHVRQPQEKVSGQLLAAAATCKSPLL